MTKHSITEVVNALRDAGLDPWMIVLVIFGVALIWRGPEYLKAISTCFSEHRRISGDLSRKLQKMQSDLQVKREKLANKSTAKSVGRQRASGQKK